MYGNSNYISVLIFTGLMVLVMCFVPNFIEYVENYKSDAQIAVENDYTAYFDGQEVDIDKLDLSLYNTSVDHDTKTVYITYKQKRNVSYIPFVIRH